MIEVRATRLPVLALAASMLWGCGGRPAPAPWYQAPPGLTGATGATVSMSGNPADADGPDGDTRIVTVDGLAVSPMEFDKVVLPPGDHTLGVKYNGTSQAATVTIRAILRPGASYAAKGQHDGACDADIWLEDQATNQPLGNRLEAHLMAKPSVQGGSVFAIACN